MEMRRGGAKKSIHRNLRQKKKLINNLEEMRECSSLIKWKNMITEWRSTFLTISLLNCNFIGLHSDGGRIDRIEL